MSHPAAKPKLSFDLFEAIVVASLDGWQHGGLALASGMEGHRPQDIANQSLLSRCCLVNRDFASIARKRLYSGVRYGKPGGTARGPFKLTTLTVPLSLRATLSGSASIAGLVKYLSLDARVLDESGQDRPASAFLDQCRLLVNLESLLVCDNGYARPSLSRHHIATFPAPNLVHLQYLGGNTVLLAHLLAYLPHLKSLHVGRFVYSGVQPDIEQILGTSNQPICKLEELVFQSVYHYNKEHAAYLLTSSINSLQSLTVAHFGGLFNDILPFVYKACTLSLTVKSNLFGVPDPSEEYLLENLLTRFDNLREVRWPQARSKACLNSMRFSYSSIST